MRSFVKIKPSRNGKITLSFIDKGKSCLIREFFTSLICLLMLFAKIKFSRNFPNLQILFVTHKAVHVYDWSYTFYFHRRIHRGGSRGKGSGPPPPPEKFGTDPPGKTIGPIRFNCFLKVVRTAICKIHIWLNKTKSCQVHALITQFSGFAHDFSEYRSGTRLVWTLPGYNQIQIVDITSHRHWVGVTLS